MQSIVQTMYRCIKYTKILFLFFSQLVGSWYLVKTSDTIYDRKHTYKMTSDKTISIDEELR